MHYSIDKAATTDAEGIIQFLNKVGAETDNLTFGSEGTSFTVEEERAYIANLSNSTSSAMFVAKREGRIVGVANYSGISSKARLSHRGELAISVLKTEWGKGFGCRLMEAIIDFARGTAHADIISLEVRSDNERAIRLYEKNGFEKIGCFRGFFKIDGRLVDCDLMNLYL